MVQSRPLYDPLAELPVERWRQTPLHPLYEVSDQGNVRSRRHHSKVCHLHPLKPYEGRHGYPKVQLGFRGKRIYVHALVMRTWVGPRPAGHDVDHIDFDRTNNALTNLRYLPSTINAVRWMARENGRNVWDLVADEPAPEDHTPLTDEELESYDPAADGW